MSQRGPTLKHIELAPVPLSFVPEVQKACPQMRIFHIANVPYYEEGFLYSDTFQELNTFVLKLRQPEEQVIVVVQVQGEEDEHRFQQIVGGRERVRSSNDMGVLPNVDEQSLRSLLMWSWDFESFVDTMWIAVGLTSGCQEIVKVSNKSPIQLAELARHFPVIVERGHDAAYLWLYSNRMSLQNVKENLETVLPPESFKITVKESYDQTEWAKSWEKREKGEDEND